MEKKTDVQVDIDLMYSFGVKSGLPLQRRFRCVRQEWLEWLEWLELLGGLREVWPQLCAALRGKFSSCCAGAGAEERALRGCTVGDGARWCAHASFGQHHAKLMMRAEFGGCDRHSAGLFAGPIRDRQLLPSADGLCRSRRWHRFLEDSTLHQEAGDGSKPVS